MKKGIFMFFSIFLSVSLYSKEPDFCGLWLYIDPQIAAENSVAWKITKDSIILTQNIETESGPIKSRMEGQIISFNEKKKQIKYKIKKIEGLFEDVYKMNMIIYMIYKIKGNFFYFNESDKNYPENINENPAFEKYE